MTAKLVMRFPRSQLYLHPLRSRLELISRIFFFLNMTYYSFKIYLENKVESGLAEDVRYLHAQTEIRYRPIFYQGWYSYFTADSWKVLISVQNILNSCNNCIFLLKLFKNQWYFGLDVEQPWNGGWTTKSTQCKQKPRPDQCF